MRLTIHQFSELDSTNTTAAVYLNDPATEEGTVIWAYTQTRGRGTHGKTWQSPEGNLYFSLILTPKNSTAERNTMLSLVAGMGVVTTLKELFPNLPLSLKWPNDVLIDGKKVCGILLEQHEEAVIVGIGLNVKYFPKDTDFPATCLENHTQTPELPDLLQALLKGLWQCYVQWQEQGPEPAETFWQNNKFILKK
jgi:BirA family biotin operon repressor/biotin-[acetyl-CoA-carboxylase] ligase